MSTDPVEATMHALRAGGPAALVIDGLRPDDLQTLGWSGSPTHLRHVAHELGRATKGEAEYLAVRAPTGQPVAKAGIDYFRRMDSGTVWQLVVHPELRDLGIGTQLIAEAEARIRSKPRRWAVLGVEANNPAAHSLYRQLGYTPFGDEAQSWDQETDDGTVVRYETTVTLLRKPMSPGADSSSPSSDSGEDPETQ